MGFAYGKQGVLGCAEAEAQMRCVNLSAEPTPLDDGIDPPDDLFKNYVQQPRNVRKCIQCNKWHDLIVENSYTGERLSEIDKCKHCFIGDWFD